jgi:hypothetical protein
MVAMWCFGLTINDIDRSHLSVALPKMNTELGLGLGVASCVGAGVGF